MKRALVSLTVFVALSWTEPARAGSLDIRVGGFLPRADTGARNDLFRDDSELYTVQGSDWRGVLGGVQLNMKLARNLELGLAVDGYGRTVHTAYRDYERPSGRDIQQSLKLDIVPIGVELRLTPTRRSARLSPFVGVGGDLLYWKYEEFGDFVRFSDPRLPVVEDSFVAEGVAPGFHVSGGLRFAVTDDIGVVGQARYQWGKADMGDDFRGNKLDLTGASVTAGINIRF